MPFDTSNSPAIAPIAAYVCTNEGATVARNVLESSVGHSDELHGGGLSGAARLCISETAPDIILAELGNISVSMACECITEICNNGADVIVIGDQTDITTYRALIKAGALEFFTLPVTAEEILSVERAAPKQQETPAPQSRSTSVAVVGCSGGVGASLLAQNIAFHASSAKGGAALRTGLIDADLEFGSQAIDMDREETVGLFEALISPDRIDTTFIAATMDHLTDHLSLYSRQVHMGQDATPLFDALPHVYAPLMAEFDSIITDLPRNRLVQNFELAALFDAVILVIPPGFSGVNAARRLIDGIAAHAPDVRIIPVLSDVRPDARLSQKDIAQTIGHPVVATLPRSDAPLMRAHRAARPLIEMQPKGAYAKAIRAVWATATAEAQTSEKAPRRSFLKRFFR
ncbi:hypothetical protein ABMC88_05145 [Sulfitobacter sp. HNIBRBA2951]|uniref:AAA family ATPase n=1 Tax=Sulfitobacter aquimarinus TaxID=3158557 RepID=UPI0032DEA892